MGFYHPRREREQIFQTAQGLITETYPRSPSGNAGSIMVDGTAYFIGVGLRAGDVVTKIAVVVSTLGADITLSKVGLYSKAGTKLAESADQGTGWQTTGIKNISLSTPYTVPADDGYYVCIVAKATTTMPTMMRGSVLAIINGAIGSGMGPYGVMTGQTDLPSPATIAVGTGSPIAYWAGIS